MDNITVTTHGVEKLLRNIKKNKASGPDSLPNRMLQFCTEQVAPALTTIFNQSITEGQLPSDWRNSSVTPIYKKGDLHQDSN